MKKLYFISGTAILATLSLLPMSRAQQPAQAAGDMKPYTEVKAITSAGARALIDACSAWASEHHYNGIAMVVIDSGGNILEARGSVGVPNNLDTALLKAKSALRWRRPNSETAESLKPGHFSPAQFVPGAFPIPGGLPIVLDGDEIGAMGVSLPAPGEECIKAAMDKVFNGQATTTNRPQRTAPPAMPSK